MGTNHRPKPWVLGLTGPSGSGKSTVCTLLRQGEMGSFLRFIDADQVSRQVVEPGLPCLRRLTQVFGEEILLPDGHLDRRKLGGMVFGDPEKVELLNQTTLPFIVEEIRQQIKAYALEDGVRGIILDAPTLFESGADKMCSQVASVLAPRELRLERICQRDGISPEAAEKRLNSQHSDDFYRRRSRFVLTNGDSRERLEEEVCRMLRWLEDIDRREYRSLRTRQRRRASLTQDRR